MTLHHDSFRGLLLAVGILVIVAIASARGYLLFVNGAFYDWASMLALRSPADVLSPVLEIDVDPVPYQSDDQFWAALIVSLSDLKPKQIVLLERPAHLAPETYSLLAKTVDLVGVSASPWLLSGADALVPLQIWANRPQSDHGVFRRMSLTLPDDAPGRSTLLKVAAIAHAERELDLTEVYPNFVMGSSKPPRISAERFLDMEIPSSIVAGKTLLLAPRPSSAVTELFTPGGRAGVTDVSAFKARALDSLLTNRYVMPFPLYNTLAILLVLGIGCLFFYQRAGFSLALKVTVGLVVLSVVISIVLLHWTYILFPLTEILAVVLGMWITVMNRKYVAEQQGMLLELNNISRLMQKRLVPVDVLHSEKYWENIANMVQRLLQLDRSIFLETLPGERRVREIYSINCDLSVIDERRRDYERAPYTIAMRTRGPTPVDGFLKDAGPAEQQYLVPLQMDGRVLGFWAFGIASDYLDARKLVSVGRFARDISELLYQRQQVREADELDRRRWLDYLTLQGGRSLARDLKAALGVTTKRLRVIEDLFQRSKSGYLLYDAFGQLLLDNPPAAHLCQELGLQAYDLNYTDTLSYLSGLDLEAAKNCLQRVVLDGESVSLPLNSQERKDLEGTLTVTAIAGDDSEHSEVIETAENSSLTLSGVFIEIRPRGGNSEQLPLPSWLDQVFAQQEQLLQRLTHKLTHLQSDHAVAPELATASSLAAHAHSYLRAIESGVLGGGEVAPFDQILIAAISNQDKLIRRKRLTVEPNLPACRVLALVPFGQLTKLLDDLLNIAVDDAKRGSTIRILQRENWPTLHVSICSDGIGIPVRRLDELLSAQTSVDRGSSLPRCKAIVEQAGGTLTIASEVGQGTSFDLRLPAVPAAGDG